MRERCPLLVLLLPLLASACASDGVAPDPPPSAPEPAPQVDIRAPEWFVRPRVPSIEVRGTAAALGGVGRMAYTLGKREGIREEPIPIDPGPAVTFSFVLRGFAPGETWVKVHAYDAAGARGTDSVVFTYAVNRPPVAVADSAMTWPGRSVTVPVLANDTDPESDTLRVVDVGRASLGELGLNRDGTVTYVPGGRLGKERVPYRVVDQVGDTATGLLTLAVVEKPAYLLTEIVLPTRGQSPSEPLGFEFPVEINEAGVVLVTVMYGCNSGGITCVTRPSDREAALRTLSGWKRLFSTCGSTVLHRADCDRRYYDVNDAGQVLRSTCGTEGLVAGNQRGCNVYGYALETVDGALVRRFPERATSADATRYTALNARGDVVIDSMLYRGETVTALRSPWGSRGTGERINGRGDVVGFGRAAGGEIPVLWRGGAPTLLAVGDSATASDVNDAGVVVGAAKRPEGWGLFVWENGTTTFVAAPGRVPGRWYNIDPTFDFRRFDYAPPRINARGRVTYTVLEAENRAYLWEKGRSVPVESLVPGARISAVHALNDRGEMVVYGRADGGTRDALFLLAPVP